MKIWAIIILFCLLIAPTINALVHKVTSSNIDAYFALNDIVVLNFCAPWSTQCKAMDPEYEKASNASYPLGKIFFGTVDAKAEGKLRNQYNVWSYPYITIRKTDGTLTPYRGRVDAAGIISYVKRTAFTNFLPISTPNLIDEFLHFEDVAVLGYFEEDKKEYRNFYEIAKRLQSKIMIGFTTNGTHILSNYGVQPSPASVLVFKRFDNSMLVYQSDYTMQNLASWILESTKLNVNFLQQENAFKYLGFKIPGVLLFLDTLKSNFTTLDHSTFQQVLSSDASVRVTTIRNSTSPSSSSPFVKNSTLDDTTTTQTISNQDSTKKETTTLQQNDNQEVFHASPFGSNEAESIFDVTRHTTALRAELPERECKNDYLVCLAMFHEMAPTLKGKLNFIYTDGVSFKPFMNRLGLDTVPSMTILDWSQEKHYLFDPTLPLTTTNLKIFFSDFFDGNLLHYVRSAPTIPSTLSPPSSTSSPSSSSTSSITASLIYPEGTRLVHVVADNFKELVLNNSKNVLLNIHLPWCGYCKAIWPSYEKLSAIVSDDIIIADFDASLNDMPRDFPVSAWPTLFPHLILFPSNDKSTPISLIKELSLQNMIEFLVDNVPDLLVNSEPSESSPEDEAEYLRQLLNTKTNQ